MNKLPNDEKLWGEFRQKFAVWVVGDIEKSLQAGVGLGTIILTTVGIECLSGYYAGEETERKHFVKFMQDFMPAYGNYADDIYACIRNGLAHDYVIKRNTKTNRSFKIRDRQGEPHLTPSRLEPDVIYFNRETFARDFLEAQRRYFEKAENDQSTWDTAMQRLKSPRGFLTVRPEEEFTPKPKP